MDSYIPRFHSVGIIDNFANFVVVADIISFHKIFSKTYNKFCFSKQTGLLQFTLFDSSLNISYLFRGNSLLPKFTLS